MRAIDLDTGRCRTVDRHAAHGVDGHAFELLPGWLERPLATPLRFTTDNPFGYSVGARPVRAPQRGTHSVAQLFSDKVACHPPAGTDV